MIDILIVIIVVGLLLLIMFLLVYYIVKRVNLLMKDNFIDKLTEFDFLIDNKEKKLEDLNNNILEKESTINELEKSVENN